MSDNEDLVKQPTAFESTFESARPATRGGPTYYSNQYNINQHMYPSDLMDPTGPYGGNYVVFYINVHEDSMLLRDNKVTTVDGNIPNRTKGFLNGQAVDEESTKKTFIGISALSGAAAQSAMGAIGLGNSKIADLAVNPVTSGLIGASVVDQIGKVKAEYKRIQDAIALYVPMDLTISYGVNWEQEDMAGMGAAFGAGENLLNAITGKTPSGQELTGGGRLDQLKSGLKSAQSAITGAVLTSTPPGQALGKLSGTAANPKKEQMFQSVDFRTFTFTYQFFSRSPEEAQNVRDIINLFKLHMYPEYKKDTGNFLYVYPSEFDIFYYNNGKENMNLHRHTSCVLTNMNVQYTPLGSFAAFADGMPTQINITLTFKELALLSKELIQDGF